MEIKDYWQNQLEKGEKLFTEGEIKKAFDFFIELLNKRKESLKGDENDACLSDIYSDCGICLKNMGDYEKAEKYYKKSYEIKVNLGQTDSESYLLVCINIAEIYKNQGRYFESEGIYLNLMKNREKYTSKHIYYLTSNLNSLYIRMGSSFEKGIEPLYYALKKIVKTHGYKNLYFCNILNNLSVIYRNRGDLETAERLLNKSLGVLDDLNSRHRYLAVLKFNLSKIQMQKKNWDTALALITEVMSLINPEFWKGTIFAEMMANLSDIYENRGEKELAIEYLRKSVEIFENLNVETFDYAIALLKLNCKENDLTGVLNSSEMINRFASKILRGLSKNDKLTLLENIKKSNDLLINFIANTPKLEAGAVTKLYSSMAQRKGISSAIENTEEIRLGYDSDEYRKLKSEYAGKILFNCEEKAEEVQSRIAYLERSIRTIESENTRLKTKAESEYSCTADLMNNLPQYTILFDYHVYRDERSGKNRLVCFTADYENNFRFINICDLCLIEDKINEYFENFKKADNCYSKELFGILFGKTDISGYENIIICPAGILCTFPFDALELCNGRFLIEEKKLFHIYSLNSLQHFSECQRELKTVHTVSNSDFAFENPYGKSFRNLENVSGEYEKMRELFEAKGISLHSLNSKSELLSTNIGSILHFSSHGHMFEKNDIPYDFKTFIFMSTVEEQLEITLDNILCQDDISYMDLRETDFVFLAACFSGTGTIHSTEGVLNFARCFINRGVASVITSLWNIPDMFAKEMVIDFYDMLLNGENVFESLRNSKINMIRKLRNEYGNSPGFYWSFFTLYENPFYSIKK